jgi:L-lactate dehydrogenase complex protein LldG
MSAREDILSNIRARSSGRRTHPPRYEPPALPSDLPKHFAERAMAQAAEIRVVASLADVPLAVADILRGRNMAAQVHLPPDPKAEALSWDGGIALRRDPPGPDDAALAFAPFAIAESGTLVYAAAKDTPPSWHFRPGLEIAVIRAADILASWEDVLARLRKEGTLPSTLNLVTGPSRTGDIEQTLELGAHGPKTLAILIVED